MRGGEEERGGRGDKEERGGRGDEGRRGEVRKGGYERKQSGK